MRDYGKVSPQFWIGSTGRQLRETGPEAQVLALYLLTSPHSSMTGVYACPLLYMAHETGLGMEGASKALARLIEVGFVEVDESSEHVFVVNMAAHQIDDALKPGDKRILGLRKDVDRMPLPLRKRFLEVYGEVFMLVEKAPEPKPLASPLVAPTKPGTETGTETGVVHPPPLRGGPPAVAGNDSTQLTAKDLVAEGVDAQVAADWLKVRRAKKAPLTRTALDGIRREAESCGLSLGQAVKHAAEAGWQGFKASWLKEREATARSPPVTADPFVGAH